MAISRRNFILAGGAGFVSAPAAVNYLQGPQGVERPTKRSGGDSLWSELAAESTSLPSLQQDTVADVCIVGGGYTGLVAAIYLKRQRSSLRVIVLESHYLGAGASSRNSGAVYAKFTGLEDQALADRGLQRFKSFLEEESVNCDFKSANTLFLYRSESQATKAKEKLAPQESWLNSESLNQQISTSFYRGAKVAADFFRIQPASLLQEYRRIAINLGVIIYEQSPVLGVQSGHSNILKTDKASVRAAQVLLATNAYTPRLGVAASKMFPVHQYSCASPKLTQEQIQNLGLDKWDLRFEPNILPITFGLSATGHFFLRLVLGYASHDSSEWQDKAYARQLALRLFQERYPQIADIGLPHEWFGVTGHTLNYQSIVSQLPMADGSNSNVYFCGAYNGLGIMPSHYSAYLSAQKILGDEQEDWQKLSRLNQHMSFPGDYYRSLMLKSSFNLMNAFSF